MQIGVDLFCVTVDSQRGARRLKRVGGRIGVLENDHEAIAGCFIDVAVVLMDII